MARITQYSEALRRKRSRKKHIFEALSAVISSRDNFRVNTSFAILDRLDAELRNRCEAYTYLNKNFGFLMKISTMFPTGISSAVHNLSKELPGDLEPDSLTKECIHFASHIKTCDDQRHTKNATDMLQRIRVKRFTKVYPNMDIALRIHLGLMITNCSIECSYSCLKRIKNYLRSTLIQDSMSDLFALCTESEVLKTIECDAIINKFSMLNAR